MLLQATYYNSHKSYGIQQSHVACSKGPVMSMPIFSHGPMEDPQALVVQVQFLQFCQYTGMAHMKLSYYVHSCPFLAINTVHKVSVLYVPVLAVLHVPNPLLWIWASKQAVRASHDKWAIHSQFISDIEVWNKFRRHSLPASWPSCLNLASKLCQLRACVAGCSESCQRHSMEPQSYLL